MSSRNSSRNLFLSLVLAASLSGCAEMAFLLPDEPLPTSAIAPTGDAPIAFLLSGRLAVRHDGEGFSGSLRWRHDSAGDDVLILSPLGQGVARVIRDMDGVTLTTAEQETHHAADAETLTQEILGWSLPLRGLQYWVTGRAAPGSEVVSEPGENGLPARLRQDGWQIDIPRYRAEGTLALPGKIEMTRGEQLEVRLVIDRWVLDDAVTP